MEYQVSIEIVAKWPVTEEQLFDVAAIGGVATGNVDDRRIGTAMTVVARDPATAVRTAISRVSELVSGEVVAAEALTVEEAERRLAEPTFPDVVGITEVARILGVSRQRASALQRNRAFPAPVALLASGPIWRRADLGRFLESWSRRPGRPRTA
jgi:hypothetical protein